MNKVKSEKPTLILVDGSSYLFRAFHALPPLTSPKGMPTGALYGVANMLRKLRDEAHSGHMAVVFDAGGKTFRHALYSEYKANRPPLPDDLRIQIEPLHELVEILGYPLIKIPGVEADDVIGTLSYQAINKGFNVVISTGDKDMAQLVQPGVSLVNTMKHETLDEAGVEAKFGVKPDQIIDYLGLMGDSSDNIPGVPKVGPKTAVKWLQQYGTVENLIEHAHEIKGKIGENLRHNQESLALSQDLATIRTELELDCSVEALKLKPEAQSELQVRAQEYGFKSWLNPDVLEAGTTETETVAALETAYEMVLETDQWQQWLEQIKQADVFSFDLETTSLDYMQAEIVGLSFSVEPGQAAYVPLKHDAPGSPVQLPLDQILKDLKPILEDPKQLKIGQHFKYDMNVLARYGIQVQGLAFDSMLESYVWDAAGNRHDMDTLASKYLGVETTHFEDIAGKGKNQLTFNAIDVETATHYAAEDADITLRLHQTLWDKLQKEAALVSVLQTIEMPLVPVLAAMEQTGVLIDDQKLQKQSHELGVSMLALEQACHELAGHPFNLGSPKQLQHVLFEEMEIPVKRKTPKGQPSTAEDVLHELAEDGHELPEKILSYRSLSKLKSTYTDKLPQLIQTETGRVHTSYHQAVAATGRLSSSDPNLQNIPIRTSEGRKIREAFIAPEGWLIMASDYSQIELRIMAHLSGDQGLLDAFKAGKDIHSATAAEVFGAEPDGSVNADNRRKAKAINFGLIYGMSAFGLSRQLGLGRNEAQEYIDLYFSRYPGVKTYMDQTREMAKEKTYVETLFGRRLYLPEIRSRNHQRRQAAERAAINAPMQGTAADIIKKAMIQVHEQLQDQAGHARLIMQVHDELVLEVNTEDVERIKDLVETSMSSAAKLDVPLLVETGTGPSWDAAH